MIYCNVLFKNEGNTRTSHRHTQKHYLITTGLGEITTNWNHDLCCLYNILYKGGEMGAGSKREIVWLFILIFHAYVDHFCLISMHILRSTPISWRHDMLLILWLMITFLHQPNQIKFYLIFTCIYDTTYC